ncbi:hypothetical protein CC1G_01905 [Coprinopsis cinerea okayama7|uniref:Uncharacterized protein n=1 Tax=Coprinopsis cinerea (strain Okayama-7 / 130 / ATCC MYA-4618 / FGSC 9003) TaxID=240176 RepID=A8N5X4_COPC7|nr:hypothetical protein CC1G_01905 [Coprinopsis cinerea okayama7\|eukprot:XP_001830269.2 hypothetical protein CC1G_01905 [Coprinopsis cinerea okayama7\
MNYGLIYCNTVHDPPLIKSSVKWFGKHEYLAVLATQHGRAWKEIYESKDWYTILVPPKPSTPPRGLRRRRMAPGALKEPSPGLEYDLEELPASRANASRANSPERTTDLPAGSQATRTRAGRSKPKAATQRPAPSAQQDLPNARILTMSPERDLTPLSDVIDLSPDMSVAPSRRKRNANPSSRYRDASSSGMEISPALVEASLLLAPAVIPASQTHTHTRTRSTSTDSSSADTVVQPTTSRSSSVLSGLTIVSTGEATSVGKRKADVIEEPGDEEGGSNNAEQSDLEEEVAVTRSRAARNKKQVKHTPADAVATKGKATKASQPGKKRARKA